MGQPAFVKIEYRIKSVYIPEWHFFRSKLWLWFKLSLVLFLISLTLFFLFFSYQPTVAETLKRKGGPLVREPGHLDAGLHSDSLKQMSIYFIHNLQACLLQIASGLIPFLFLPFVSVILSGFIDAVFLATWNLFGSDLLDVYLTTVFPHAIFEYAGIFYSAGLGMFLCGDLSKKVLGRDRKDSLTLLTGIKQVSRSYIFVIIPLFAIAAIMEVLITPLFN